MWLDGNVRIVAFCLSQTDDWMATGDSAHRDLAKADQAIV